MEKEFVTYEQALALKKLGFDDKCIATIHDNGYIHRKGTRGLPSRAFVINKVDVPLKQQVFRWFREKKLHNTFPYIIQTRSWATLYKILKWNPENDSTSILESGYYDTYEEAENACIDKLIEITKQ